jgi:hypothetical protein
MFMFVRVTRLVCEEIVQHVAQPIFVKKNNQAFHRRKKWLKIWAT